MDRWIDERMDGWMIGWMSEKREDGWMNGWIYGLLNE